MNSPNVILVGLKRRVAAVSKPDGRILWSTELPGGFGQGFVTLLSDETKVFAYHNGSLYCLDLADGRILWSNGLPSYGYGIATLCLPGGASAPDPATVQQLFASRRQSDDSGGSAAAPG